MYKILPGPRQRSPDWYKPSPVFHGVPLFTSLCLSLAIPSKGLQSPAWPVEAVLLKSCELQYASGYAENSQMEV